MTHPLQHRVTLLTGCASGIGAHLAASFVRAGCTCLLTDLRTDTLQQLAEREQWDTERVRIAPLDVRSSEDWDRAVEMCRTQWGRLDVLINIAGVLKPNAVRSLCDDEVDLQIDTNLKGVILGTRAVTNVMISQRSGHIINVASLAALSPVPGASLYSASKAGVRSFSLSSAFELQEYGVAVTALLPDATRTPMLDRVRRNRHAALIFSGDRPLSVHEVEEALVDDILVHRPLEVALPSKRATMARIANVFPGAARILYPILRRRGLFNQRRS